MKNLKKICFIGMSGVGKSHWAKELANCNYKAVSCDDLIAEKIFNNSNNGFDSLCSWLGYPWEDDFAAREAEYLKFETTVVAEHFSPNDESKIILDTTGSVIYCKDQILKTLKENFLIVYFSLTSEYRQKLLKSYQTNPRPIVWREVYIPEKDLSENYNNLVLERESQYKNLADVEISCETLQTLETPQALLDLLQK